MIPLFKPYFRVEECLEQIKKSLEIGWTGQGFLTLEFESAWGVYTGTKNNLMLNSASAALHLSLESMKQRYNWNQHTEVISTPLTFVSTNHAILWANLKPIFADVDESLCLDPTSVRTKITKNTKALIYVAIGGNAANLAEIRKICKEFEIKLIVDAAHAAGSLLDSDPIGNGADATCYSFQAVKNLPTADSGLVHILDSETFEITKQLAWCGISESTFNRTSKTGYKWEYDVDFLGFKDNGNSIMAALALIGLKYLDQDNNRRRQISKIYDELIGQKSKVKKISHVNSSESSRHLYQVIVENREIIAKNFTDQNIGFGVHYRTNTKYPMYSKFYSQTPNANALSEKILSLPIFLEITPDEQAKVVEALECHDL